MAAFEYSALNARGKQEKGLIEAETARQARQLLRERALTPLELREVAARQGRRGADSGEGPVRRRGGGSLSATELSLFTRQLATLFRSGLPLDEALTAVAQQSENPKVQRMVLAIRSRVNEGESLAHALGQFPGAFPTLFRATVEAGEQAGKLDHVLERLADYVERRQAMQSKILLATFYPAILTLVAIGVVSLLLTYVVPKVVEVFDNIGAELPLLTRMLIGLSGFLRSYGVFLVIGLVVAGWLFARAMRNDEFKRRVHVRQLKLPLIGRLTRGANTGRFTRTLGILFGAGVPILDAMRIGTQVVTNLPMHDAIQEAARRVREGAGLAKSLEASRLFPPITVHLIASGEASGKLDEMLDRAADNQEREVETLIAALMGVFEPVLILAMGGVVLLIVLAILLPIFDLNTLVK
ncbi:MAG: type II secretion system inner membrane protein GspF [Stagnimonas sp.]|nr:type II secretion system inner membrane protein GspF [Stagnimonas sp.]